MELPRHKIWKQESLTWIGYHPKHLNLITTVCHLSASGMSSEGLKLPWKPAVYDEVSCWSEGLTLPFVQSKELGKTLFFLVRLNESVCRPDRSKWNWKDKNTLHFIIDTNESRTQKRIVSIINSSHSIISLILHKTTDVLTLPHIVTISQESCSWQNIKFMRTEFGSKFYWNISKI